MSITVDKTKKVFGGQLKLFSHESTTLKCKMDCAVYCPPMVDTCAAPVLYYLGGLTNTCMNFQKVGLCSKLSGPTMQVNYYSALSLG